MSSGLRLSSPNRLVEESRPLLAALQHPQGRLVLAAIGALTSAGNEDRVTEALLSQELGLQESAVAVVVSDLIRADLVGEGPVGLQLSSRGRRWFCRIVTDLGSLEGAEIGGDNEGSLLGRLEGRYRLSAIIGRGGTSLTFEAEQLITHAKRAVKVIYPGYASLDEVSDALAKRQQVQTPVIPGALDAGLIDGSRFKFGGNPLSVVQDLVADNARTLDEFLREEFYSPAHVLGRFISEVGSALIEIHGAGLQHGDLHSGNILVSNDAAGEPQFHVIDFVGVDLTSSPSMPPIEDDEAFFYHLFRSVMIAHDREPELPLRRLLGERVWRVVDAVRSRDVDTIDGAVQLLQARPSRLSTPLSPARTRPFEWLRVESIPSPVELLKLFEPSLGRFEEIRQFGNMWITGPRGSGKSHYVRVLAFYPGLERDRLTGHDDIEREIQRLKLDYRERLGVLIPCRVGTFKAIDPSALGHSSFPDRMVPALKDLLVLTVLSHTLEILVAGSPLDSRSGDTSPLGAPTDPGALWEYWRSRAPGPVSSGSPISTLEQVREEVSRELLKVRRTWYQESDLDRRYLDDADLAEFFSAVSLTFDGLRQTRFELLFDDVTDGIVHLELQKVLNSLVRSAGEKHCFKLTCEKYQYTLEASDGRAIEFPHDASFVDLGELAVGTTKDSPSAQRSYLASVIDRRLRFGGWDAQIQGLIGKSERPSSFLRRLQTTYGEREDPSDGRGLGRGDDKARYAGWNVYCHLSHGSVRNLLEMLEHTFAVAGGTEQALAARTISKVRQDQALREYSRRHWMELQNLPGRIKRLGVGTQLQGIAAALGELSRRLLLYYSSTEPYEALSIERLDPYRPLSDAAEQVLEQALRYGVLVETGVNFSRSHRGLTRRLDLNKLFAPAFRTTYRVRNHIYVGPQEFEELLLSPGAWVKRRSEKLSPRPGQDELPL